MGNLVDTTTMFCNSIIPLVTQAPSGACLVVVCRTQFLTACGSNEAKNEQAERPEGVSDWEARYGPAKEPDGNAEATMNH